MPKDASRLRACAAELRRFADEGEPLPVEVIEAMATLIDVEAGIREEQPAGFYEVADADKVADALLPPEGVEDPIRCAYCRRLSDPEVAYYGPNGFTLCDDCAQEVEEEFGDQ